jgi:hypothetical protein
MIIEDSDTLQSLQAKLRSPEMDMCHIIVKHRHIPLLLANFRENRSAKRVTVEKHLKLFRTGEFWNGGEKGYSLLHADKTGKMANGGNRLTAQQAAGVDQEYDIQLGLSEAQVQVLDLDIRVRDLEREIYAWASMWAMNERAKVNPGGRAEAVINKGIEVELEHTKDRDLAEKIVLDHLAESPKYYEALEEMESKLEDSQG